MQSNNAKNITTVELRGDSMEKSFLALERVADFN